MSSHFPKLMLSLTRSKKYDPDELAKALQSTMRWRAAMLTGLFVALCFTIDGDRPYLLGAQWRISEHSQMIDPRHRPAEGCLLFYRPARRGPLGIGYTGTFFFLEI